MPLSVLFFLINNWTTSYPLLSVVLHFFHSQILPFEASYKSNLYLCFNKLTYIPSIVPISFSSVLKIYSSVSNDTSIENFPLVLEFTATMASVFLHHLFLMAIQYPLRRSTINKICLSKWPAAGILFSISNRYVFTFNNLLLCSLVIF